MDKSLKDFEKTINIEFGDKDLLRKVFVHRSYLNEHPEFINEHNERLEFLGDAVLELIVTEYLYKQYDNPEGELTNWRSALVRGVMLSKIADELGMNDYLYLSRGEQKSSGKARQIILANTFEALIGAIYLDNGYEVTKKFIHEHLIHRLPKIIESKSYLDAKSKLQEVAQDKYSITPLYKVIDESGPDHDKHFDVGVYLADKRVGSGAGSSKQEAEQNAARKALQAWGELK